MTIGYTAGIDPPGAGAALLELSQELESAGQDLSPRDLVLIFTAPVLGAGDVELGRSLMRSLLYALQETAPPRALVFLNSGVELVAAGAPALDALSALARQGAEILPCAASLRHYGLEASVGEPATMYRIVDLITSAQRVVAF